MLGDLTSREIDQVLEGQCIARLGCYANGEIFVVPVTYVYNETYIYAHSPEGSKIRMMRENNHVCIEIDDLHNMTNWRSVILWGTYEELIDKEAQHHAADLFRDKLQHTQTSETAIPQRQTMSPAKDTRKTIFYRIKIERKTGRFEKA